MLYCLLKRRNEDGKNQRTSNSRPGSAVGNVILKSTYMTNLANFMIQSAINLSLL